MLVKQGVKSHRANIAFIKWKDWNFYMRALFKPTYKTCEGRVLKDGVGMIIYLGLIFKTIGEMHYVSDFTM